MGYGGHYLWLNRIPPNVWTMDNFKSIPALHSANFALVKINDNGVPWNSYLSFPPGSTISDLYTLKSVTATVSGGHISILLPENRTQPGLLLEASSLLMDQECVFETRKIYTEEKLGKGYVAVKHPTNRYPGQGSSGAWVFRSSSLLGMIIAVYGKEPYAHMLPMHQIFEDIRATYTGGTSRSDVDVNLLGAIP